MTQSSEAQKVIYEISIIFTFKHYFLHVCLNPSAMLNPYFCDIVTEECENSA